MTNPIRSNDELYDIIEKALKNITEPQTAAALMERVEVRKAACDRFGKDMQTAINKLSDRLGFMWRRGILDRFPATASRTMSRWAYALKAQFEEDAVKYVTPRTQKKAAIAITEKEGEVVLEFEQFTVVIKPK